ncbi:8899_t:CDS:2 [Funneliformis caledonium]|uniref:8899_t:CDS:1 n=1 Tax=Funneliformis caledonium TaxID=1117310 RepID=A0A9N9AGX1_9GLOM|nr:8899_t:CDS:2 [Funneliformis caledonium]
MYSESIATRFHEVVPDQIGDIIENHVITVHDHFLKFPGYHVKNIYEFKVKWTYKDDELPTSKFPDYENQLVYVIKELNLKRRIFGIPFILWEEDH